jgi:hypothetical protein
MTRKSKSVKTKKRNDIYTRNKSKSGKTKKRKITYSIKHTFINELLREWKEQTSGFVFMDQMGSYKNDYYLTFARKGGYNNHIHVILKNFNDNHNTRNICYMLKYLNKDTNEIVHSQEYKIIIYSNPKTVVKNMIRRYKKFANY